MDGSSPSPPPQLKIIKKIRINNQITAPEVRTIDETGKNLGVLKTAEAIGLAKEKGLDLIEVTSSVIPPIAKIMDYGKFQYQEQKKSKEAGKKSRTTEVRIIRIGIGTSEHDLEMKAKKISGFLKQRDKVKIDLVLRGREKYLDKDFITGRLNRIMKFIAENHKITDGPKRAPSGLYVIIEYAKN